MVTTQSGVGFDAGRDRWSYVDGLSSVSLDFTSLEKCSQAWVNTAKKVFTWYAARSSPDHLLNLFSRLVHFTRHLGQGPATLFELQAIDLLNYKDALKDSTAWYLGTLVGFFKKWYALGYPGISSDAVLFMKQFRNKGNRKGEAVLTQDPLEGPFTYLELESIQAALNNAYAEQRIDIGKYLLVWLYILLGQRPVQYAALKVCDVGCTRSEQGSESFSLQVPRAKMRETNPRAFFTERIITPQIGTLLFDYVKQVAASFDGILPDSLKAPLFPCGTKKAWAPGFEFHRSARSVSVELQETVEKFALTSERTGKLLHITALRFRRTLGTRAAEEGHSPLIIAQLLDHTDTQNVGVYTASTPAIIERIDRAVALQMAPLAQAFAGVLVGSEIQATRGHDPSSRIVDLRIDRSGKPMGSCGQHGFCSFNAPIACYTCRNFEPWLDAPHEAVLECLLEKRDALLTSTDKRMASVNDRTILAVAQVIQLCEQRRAEVMEDI